MKSKLHGEVRDLNNDSTAWCLTTANFYELFLSPNVTSYAIPAEFQIRSKVSSCLLWKIQSIIDIVI